MLKDMSYEGIYHVIAVVLLPEFSPCISALEVRTSGKNVIFPTSSPYDR